MGTASTYQLEAHTAAGLKACLTRPLQEPPGRQDAKNFEGFLRALVSRPSPCSGGGWWWVLRRSLRYIGSAGQMWIVVMITALAFALRLVNLARSDLTFDEAASALIARMPLSEMIPYLLRAIHEHPPGYYVLLSGWMRLVGDGEAMLRLLSVFVGTLSVPLMYRWAREALGAAGGLIAALILSLTPFHVYYSQDARMYPIVGALALLSWWLLLRLQRSDRVVYWLSLSASGLFGLLAHYYMGLVILSCGAYLFLTRKQNGTLLRKWLVWLGAPIGLGVIYIAAAPGALATLLVSFGEGLGSTVSERALRNLAATLIFGPQGNLGINVWSVVLLVVMGGVGLALTGRVGVKRHVGLMLACAMFVPFGLILVLPESIAARYVLFLIFPIVLALTVVIVSPLTLRQRGARAARWAWPLTAALALALIGLNISRLPYHYDTIKGDYGRLMARLRAGYQPGDAVIFNGPWQAVLQSYYSIGNVPAVYLPPATPPALDPVATEPQLVELLRSYRRIWVIPLETAQADPDRFVATWLNRNAHHALEDPDIALYYAPPTSDGVALDTPVQFGHALELVSARLAGPAVDTGDAVIVSLEWRTLQSIQGDVRVSLELVDPGGIVWGQRLYQPGERYTTAEDWDAGQVVIDRQAVLVDPGAPPGDYTLRVAVQRASTGEILVPSNQPDAAFTALASIQVTAAQDISDSQIPGTAAGARFGDSLALMAFQLPATQFVQGGTLPVKLYWRALDGDRDVDVDVALVDAAGVPVDVSSGLLGPAWYPAVSWRVGEVVATLAVLRVPPRQAPGTYYLQVAVRDRAGQTLAGEGPIERPGLFSLWTERIQARQTAWRLGEVSVTARNRNFVAPAVQYPLAVTFGDQIRLVGYDLDVSEARPGGHLRITFVWQALRSTEQNHVVFTHLRDAGGVLRGQRDSMPVGGSNPTPYWETGEVVVDTYLIAIDPAAPPGRHTLGFGWYESDSGTRLAAVAADGTRWRDDIVLIGDLPVAAPAAP